MVTTLAIGCELPLSRPHRRHPPPQTRTLLPVLTRLYFEGISDFLEDLVARIDAPLLNSLAITFFYRPKFGTPQLTEFISRTPKLKLHDNALAHVGISSLGSGV